VHVVATAGHVDHGKSTLVRALTGIDPDRLAEEKERGLTIDLGFAWTDLPSGRGVAFVDVPGHVRFIKNMLAGVGAVDACLFVVAATEGWKPQSEEHLRILELLGIEHGVVALTKVGLVDDELRELAQLDVLEHVAGTFLEEAPIVAVDPVDGAGMDELLAALDELTATTPTAIDRDRPRLWVDRVFAATGSGTVVTGTLTGGTFATGESVTVEPGHRFARIRAIQSRKDSIEQIGPGNRVALNLTGIDHDELTRGDAIVRPDQWHRSSTVDAELTVLPALTHEVGRRGAYVMHMGSGEWPVRLRVLGRRSVPPGETAAVRLHLPTTLPMLPGDRFVLRETGRIETVGGGRVLDVEPVLPASKARPDDSVDRLIEERGWVRAPVLERLTGERRAPTLGDWIASPRAVAATTEALQRQIVEAGSLGLDVAQLDDRQRAVLETMPDVVVIDGRARGADDPDVLADHPVVAELAAVPFAPDPPSGVSNDELQALARRGAIVQLDGVWFASSAVDRAARLVADLLAARPEGVTVADVRDAMSTTRKYVLPLLNRLDATGVTRRRGDLRIGGPRLPAAGGGC
jgi:selenocysteine-specific elongation factor